MIKTYRGREFKIRNKIFQPFKNVLVYDIETAKKDLSLPVSAENSKLKIWGAYSYNTGKLTYGKHNKEEFQKLINSHDVIVGHNIKGFDNPVMEQELEINFSGKILIDTLEVLRSPPSRSEKEAYKKKGKKAPTGKGRAKIIGEALQSGMIDNRFPNFKLSTIAKHGYKLFKDHPIYSKFFTEYKDENFNYNILNQEYISEEEWNIIKEYLRQDIIVTKNIFEFLDKYFESLAENLSDEDIINLDYLHSPTGSYFYKCICYDLNLPLLYGKSGGTFLGAKVMLPKKEKYTPENGDGYCIDWASQHPHNIWSANLATPIEKCKHKINGKCPNPYSGDGKVFKLKGTYCGCEIGEIEKWLRMMFFRRNYFKRKFIQPDGTHIKFKDAKENIKVYFIDDKRNLTTKVLTTNDINKALEKAKEGIDDRQYSIKILINSGYGVLSSSIFESTFNETTGVDTTTMSWQSTEYIAKHMEKNGYIVTYGDTDSCYIMDTFRNKQKMLKILSEGVKIIRDALPFSDMTYNMDVDAEFSHIFFFQDKDSKDLHYKKKNYIYILKPNKEGKIKVKINGLPILKSNAPKLAKKIYLNYLEKEIIKTKNIKFKKDWIKQLIEFEIRKDIEVLATEVKCNPADSYAKEFQIQAQLSRHYLESKEGQIKIIKHTRKGFGIGKGKFYCDLNDAKKLNMHEFDLDTLWKTLDPFVKHDKQLELGDF